MGKSFKICLLPGDGIGPEVMAQAVKVLRAVKARYDVTFECGEALIGGAAIDATGTAFPPETLAAARESDAVLLAAVGGPKWETGEPGAPRAEEGLFAIRKELGLYANLRPVHAYAPLVDASPLKPELVRGADVLIVRELTGGLYFGKRDRAYGVPGAGPNGAPGQYAYDTMEYAEYEVERIVRMAFELARGRRSRVHSVDKANALGVSRMWREVARGIAAEYPDVEFRELLVDNAAMQLMLDPHQFDVIVSENTFGDILSDEAAVLSASLGMLASASLGEGTALYEPVHGSAPDIAGRGIANPIAQILSVEMMLRYSCKMQEAADAIAQAVERVLDAGYRTADIADAHTPANKVLGTAAMGDKITEYL
ncbi:MAG: 3-isopropylmalate dehydrogenase [Coriobacteriaceae bacterium]|nr:3-isopropylmalate dehydrogenase [Coriobacteriaceae bacterium]